MKSQNNNSYWALAICSVLYSTGCIFSFHLHNHPETASVMLSFLWSRRWRHGEVPELASGHSRIWTQVLHSFIPSSELPLRDRHSARGSLDQEELLGLVLHGQIGLKRIWWQMVPDLWWLSVWFFYFQFSSVRFSPSVVQKQYLLSRNHTLNFDLSLGLWCVLWSSLVRSGSDLETWFLVSHATHEGQQPICWQSSCPQTVIVSHF